MKKLFVIGVFSAVFLFGSSLVSEAHVLATDKSIGVVMHIDPEDDPLVGAQSAFFFEFKDKQNKFQPRDCDCTFSIIEQGNEIYQQPLFENNNQPSLTNASVFYTFPQRDVYQVVITGKPLQHYFQPFRLAYIVRVSRVATSSSPSNWFFSHIVLVIGLSILVIAFGIYTIRSTNWYKHHYKKGAEKKSHEKDPGKYY